MDSHNPGRRAGGSRSRRTAGILLMVTLALATSKLSHGQESSQLPTLTTAAQVRELTLEQANRGYPVRLRAVVTYIEQCSQAMDVPPSAVPRWQVPGLPGADVGRQRSVAGELLKPVTSGGLAFTHQLSPRRLPACPAAL